MMIMIQVYQKCSSENKQGDEIKHNLENSQL